MEESSPRKSYRVQVWLIVVVLILQLNYVRYWSHGGCHDGDFSKQPQRHDGDRPQAPELSNDEASSSLLEMDIDNNNNATTEKPRTTLLPDRLVVVYGLESSGTTFVAKSLALALGLKVKDGQDAVTNRDGSIRLQHISLPLGSSSFGEENTNEDAVRVKPTTTTTPLPIVPLLPPVRCTVPPPSADQKVRRSQRPASPECLDYGQHLMPLPASRFFVNITQHLQWHRDHGVQTQAVVVVRDKSAHFHGILNHHNPDAVSAYEQYQTGLKLIRESTTTTTQAAAASVAPIHVSYETLLTLQNVYMMQIYKQLGISLSPSSSFVTPKLKNGNVKYHNLHRLHPFIAQSLMADDGNIHHRLEDNKK